MNEKPGDRAQAAPKWAALVNDVVIPMPRQFVTARIILSQSGAADGLMLLRDFNSPSDEAFAVEAAIDLSEGNVFRTSAPCKQSRSPRGEGPPKLAVFVDDAWEIIIQPKQTGRSLRELFGIDQGVHLLRDLESPSDTPVTEDEVVKFADGPVFVTRKPSPREVIIVVEGTPFPWAKPSITHTEVATLFDPEYPQHPERTYSVTYKKGPSSKPEGILAAGSSVKVKDRMEFHVSATGQS